MATWSLHDPLKCFNDPKMLGNDSIIEGSRNKLSRRIELWDISDISMNIADTGLADTSELEIRGLGTCFGVENSTQTTFRKVPTPHSAICNIGDQKRVQ